RNRAADARIRAAGPGRGLPTPALDGRRHRHASCTGPSTSPQTRRREMANVAIALSKIKCVREQESSDEPYVLICVVDLTRKLNIPGQSAVIVPNVNTLRTGPFATSVDTGQTVAVKPLVPCWGFGGHPAVVQTPDDLIILVAMMEHDDTS